MRRRHVLVFLVLGIFALPVVSLVISSWSVRGRLHYEADQLSDTLRPFDEFRDLEMEIVNRKLKAVIVHGSLRSDNELSKLIDVVEERSTGNVQIEVKINGRLHVHTVFK